MCVYIYIYIYVEGERERERENVQFVYCCYVITGFAFVVLLNYVIMCILLRFSWVPVKV